MDISANTWPCRPIHQSSLGRYVNQYYRLRGAQNTHDPTQPERYLAKRNNLQIVRVTNVRACEPEPEPEPRAYFASHCVFFLFFFFFFQFNVNILLTKCYTSLEKQNFPIFFRALISAQVVFLSVSNLISSNGFRRSVYSFRYNLNLEFPSQIFISK